jgi:PPM family protein phosphatase
MRWNGGLSKGELASATVVRAFSEWFDEELPYELENPDLQVIGGKRSLMLKDLNVTILEYGQNEKITLGSTFTGVLFIGNQYVIAHVRDTRAYQIGKSLEQLTTDQTFVAREIQRGTMTVEEAKIDKRRNMLLQCVGASDMVEPEIIIGKQENR